MTNARARKMYQRLLRIVPLLMVLAAALPLHAHVGSPDVYEQGDAGPYKLFIVIRPPQVIPGVADIEVRSQTGGIDGIDITPIPMVGEASLHPPVPDAMKRPSSDAQYFTGHLWIMQSGSWQVRFLVRGSQGSGVLSIPVAATALRTTTMQTGMGIFLACLGVLLVVGMVGIVGAAARESQLKPGEALPAARKGYVAMAVTFALLVAAVVLGNRWWKSEALDYARIVYKPLQMQAAIEPGDVLDLRIIDPGWVRQRKLDDFVPDHDHLMHLYLLRWPGMDVVFHLHPEQAAPGDFRLALPSLPAGDYRLYADVVHASGFPETMVSAVKIPKYVPGRPLAGDDAEATAEPLTITGGATEIKNSYKLPDGYTMAWKKPSPLKANEPEEFTFTLLDPNGQPPKDMALYMGMQGHAAFVKTDGTVFAHIHPAGSAPMAAMMMAQKQNQSLQPAAPASTSMPDMPMSAMPGMAMDGPSLNAVPNSVSFPYGFPKSGDYRVFVQMKHGDTVETGVFDAVVP
ncbi:hypothetical protein [Silvibacterium sp.]|uniref:hypothetical protein n=1 Tax=Silvibacterium sp. TaxID=1964179 RepID=UPI0039E6E709